MPLLSTGLNHTTAPVEVRERLAIGPERMEQALRSLLSTSGVEEAVLLSTCNRTEIYGVAADVDRLIDWLSDFQGTRRQDLEPLLYVYEGAYAVRHMVRVSAGLDSLVLGEPQILGQVKAAYFKAAEIGATGPLLSRLFQHTFAAAKRVRTETEVGANPLSVASTAVNLAKRIFSDLGERTALLVGAGETIELVAKHLQRSGLQRMIVANRDPLRAQRIAAAYHGYGTALSDIAMHLSDADILIASTASPVPLITEQMLRRAVQRRRHQPMLVLDLAVPRDIEPAAAKLDDIYLYGIDDLHHVIQGNLSSRRTAADRAEAIVAQEVKSYFHWLKSRDAVETIKALRQRGDHHRRVLLGQARARLRRGDDPERVMEFLAYTLTNRLLHEPSVQLRRAAENEALELLTAARKLHGLSEESDDDPRSEELGQ